MLKTDTQFKTKFTGTLLHCLLLFALPVFGKGTIPRTANLKPSSTAGISGGAFLDCNNNGIRDNGEFGFDGVQVILDGTSNPGGTKLTTTTVNGGSYSFTGVAAGNFHSGRGRGRLRLLAHWRRSRRLRWGRRRGPLHPHPAAR